MKLQNQFSLSLMLWLGKVVGKVAIQLEWSG